MKLFFVYNPMSGRGQIRNKLFDIINVFSEAGYEVTVHPTRAPKDATAVVAELSDTYDLVVCSGGDGTLDEVMTGMMQRKHIVMPLTHPVVLVMIHWGMLRNH